MPGVKQVLLSALLTVSFSSTANEVNQIKKHISELSTHSAGCMMCHADKSSLIKLSKSSSNTETVERLKTHVLNLTSEQLAGRMTASPGETIADQYIITNLISSGFNGDGDNGTFFQSFKVGSPEQTANNVIAKLEVNPNAKQAILISAHVDHLGRGNINQIHPGADDNSSGVAVMLEIANKLSNLKKQGYLTGDKDIIIAAWTGEELGALGSTNYVNQQVKLSSNNQLNDKITAVINLDMVGHLQDKLIIQGVGSSQNWDNILKTVPLQKDIQLVTSQDPYLATDSTPFYLKGVPTINMFTGAHANYHTPKDTPETLNYSGMQIISDYVLNTILALESAKALPYQQVSQTNIANQQKFKVYLGTIPDYSYESNGVKLAGVVKDSPAFLAKLAQGDIIIKLANKEVKNIQEYMQILNSLEKNTNTQVLVKRDNNFLKLKICPRAEALQ